MDAGRLRNRRARERAQSTNMRRACRAHAERPDHQARPSILRGRSSVEMTEACGVLQQKGGADQRSVRLQTSDLSRAHYHRSRRRTLPGTCRKVGCVRWPARAGRASERRRKTRSTSSRSRRGPTQVGWAKAFDRETSSRNWSLSDHRGGPKRLKPGPKQRKVIASISRWLSERQHAQVTD